MEEWKEVVGFPGYEVSSLGRVRRITYLSASDDGKGYLAACLYQNQKPKTMRIHRLVAEAFLPNPDALPETDHINRDTKDNRVENLRWATRASNSQNRGTVEQATHIRFINHKYNVRIKREGVRYNKTFNTLEEAQAFRGRVLASS